MNILCKRLARNYFIILLTFSEDTCNIGTFHLLHVNLTYERSYQEKFSKILAFSVLYEELWPIFSLNNIKNLNNLVLKPSRAIIILIVVYFCQVNL